VDQVRLLLLETGYVRHGPRGSGIDVEEPQIILRQRLTGSCEVCICNVEELLAVVLRVANEGTTGLTGQAVDSPSPVRLVGPGQTDAVA
jgi:hypothetical protein